jgi:hypothetical protein
MNIVRIEKNYNYLTSLYEINHRVKLKSDNLSFRIPIYRDEESVFYQYTQILPPPAIAGLVRMTYQDNPDVINKNQDTK